MMDDQGSRPAPQDMIDRLDASARDVASGALHDAAGVDAEARRLLAEYEAAHPTQLRPRTPAPKRSRRA